MIHQGKNRPMTSQDLFKTGEEKAFFTDRMKHTSTEDREGVLTNTQSLQSYHFHHAATGVPGAGRSCPSEFCLCFSMRSRAHSPSPQLKKHGSGKPAPHLCRKAHSSQEIPSVGLQRAGTHLAAALWCLCYWIQQVVHQQLQR